ncbi:MAG: hypothetical protein JWN91_1103 [Nocardioides sp.]|nr:hypothetical protein [Nocardioides sp.]
MPAGRRLLSRRTTLALGVVGAAGALVVAGCDDDTDAPASTPTRAEDPDGDLVDSVLEELSGAYRMTVAGGFPALTAMHAAHIVALEGTPPPPAPGHATAAAVRRNEQRIQAFLVESAVGADSGALARLLASMSAAVAQQLADRSGKQP